MTGKAKGATEDVATTDTTTDTTDPKLGEVVETTSSGAGISVNVTEVKPADVEYVVQMWREFPEMTDGEQIGHAYAWVDIRTVSVPPRTKRATVIQEALAVAGITPDPEATEPLRLRALDVASAEALSFGPKPPAPPEWTVLS